ncbi:hypothetical protein [Thalassovita sp.]|jgi:hypothetical protein|uniref:hypothetical protein n=1 Tax=Thalassovita sp. TaxID=1979401 RepID=UPI003B5CA6B5
MKIAIITAIAALGFAAPAVAQNVDGDAIVMTRNAPAEAVFGPADSGLNLNSVSVTFGEQIVTDLGVSDTPSVNGVTTAYVFDGAGDTGNNDFVAY